MSFIKSGYRALLGTVLRKLGLAEPAEITLDRLRRLDRQTLLDLAHQVGLEEHDALATGPLASQIWEALHAAGAGPESDDAFPHTGSRGAEHIPWGYAEDRVTAIPVDPDRLYVYWEVTDSAIAEARRGLDAGGQDAWLSLRVYDTTGRLFDGTNAHSYFDHEIGRDVRQWFFHIGKPSSEAFVEVGMKSREGYFVKIARSGRVEFPRRGPAGHGNPEWLTVQVDHTSFSTAHHPGGPMAGPGGRPAAPGGTAGTGDHAAPGDGGGNGGTGPQASGSSETGQTATVTLDETVSSERPWMQWFSGWGPTRMSRTYEWEEKRSGWSWEAGPFTYPVDVPGPISEHFVGGRRIYQVGETTHVVYGPWELVIRGLDAHVHRTVLGRWQVYRSWTTEEGWESTETAPDARVLAPGSSERLPLGASGRRWHGESELRLGGASEAFFLGASERRLGGASELNYLAASEWRMMGASEQLMRGASERLMRGASERRLGGASEWSARGASERRLGGASEHRLAGASDHRLGDAGERVYPPLPDGDNEED